jgi:hypothetical protein
VLAAATFLWLAPGHGWQRTLVAGLAACVLVGVSWAVSALLLARLADEELAPSLGRALWCLSPLVLLGVSRFRFLRDAPQLPGRIAVAVASLIVLAHLWALCRHPLSRRRLMATGKALMPFWPLGVLLVATLGTMLYVKQRTLEPGRTPLRHPLWEISLFSPGPHDWLVRFNDAAGHSIYPGAVAMVLAAIGVLFWAPNPRAGQGASSRRWIALLASIFLLAEILSLGPHGAPLPLYRWLYDGLPYFGLMRQTSKFQVLAFFTLALLAAVGGRKLTDAYTGNRWGSICIALLPIAGVVLDYWPARPVGISLLATENRVYRALSEATDGSVVYVPIWPGDSSWSSLYEFGTTLTRRPMINGYLPLVSRRYVDEVYWPLDHLNRGELTESEYARLRALGVRFLVLDQGAFPSKVSAFPSGFTLARLRSSPYVNQRLADPPLTLFALRSAPGQPSDSLPTTPHGLFFQAARTPRQVGEVVDDREASAGHAVRAARGSGLDRGRYLLFGAKAGLPRGRFRILFRLRGRGPADRVLARIEAVTDQGSRAIAIRPLTGSDLSGRYEDHELILSLDRPEYVEFRVAWLGNGEVAVDYLYGLFADQEDPQRIFRSGDFSFDRGPYRRYAPGEYLVRFRTRVARVTGAPLVRFAVVTAHDEGVLSSCVRRGLDFEAPGIETELVLPFRLDALRVLEFRIEALAPGVSVDQITVTSRDPGHDAGYEQAHPPDTCLSGAPASVDNKIRPIG